MEAVQHRTPDTIGGLVAGIRKQVSGSTKYRRFQRMYTNDRIAFAYDMFPAFRESIADYQIEILGYFDDGHTRVAVRGPHGLGKTFIASVLVHHSVLTAEEDCKVPTTASAWRQLRFYLWPEIRKLAKYIAWADVGRGPYNPTTELLSEQIKLRGDLVQAFAVASDDHTTIEGAHATRMTYVFDESKTIPRDTWNAAEGAFSSEGMEGHEVSAFAISTPGAPSGQFYDIHMHKPGFEDWKTRHVTLDEAIRAGRISKKWARQRLVQWGQYSPLYQNRVLGEFADSSEDGVVPLSWVQSAVDRWHEWNDAGRRVLDEPHTMGVDVARGGDDRTVFAMRSGRVITDVLSYFRIPTTETADNILLETRGHAVHIETDGGLGAAVYDILKTKRHTLKLFPITVGGKTYRRDRSGELRFADVRSAMWWNMRELLHPTFGEGICLPDDEQLIGELIAPTWENNGGVIRVEKKKEIKKRIGRSTDYADAVCLAFWPVIAGGGVVF